MLPVSVEGYIYIYMNILYNIHVIATSAQSVILRRRLSWKASKVRRGVQTRLELEVRSSLFCLPFALGLSLTRGVFSLDQADTSSDLGLYVVIFD